MIEIDEYTALWFTPELQSWTDETVDSEQWKRDDLILRCIRLTEDLVYEPANLKVSESPDSFAYMYKRIIQHTLDTLDTVENLA